jgi:hypothetical protein
LTAEESVMMARTKTKRRYYVVGVRGGTSPGHDTLPEAIERLKLAHAQGRPNAFIYDTQTRGAVEGSPRAPAFAVRSKSGRVVRRFATRAEAERFVRTARSPSDDDERDWDSTTGTERRHAEYKETVFLRGWYAKKYGLSAHQVQQLMRCDRIDIVERELEKWREANGLPATNSPLTRGKLMAFVKECS